MKIKETQPINLTEAEAAQLVQLLKSLLPYIVFYDPTSTESALNNHLRATENYLRSKADEIDRMVAILKGETK